MTKLKNSVESFSIRLHKTEERINDLGGRIFEIIQTEEQKGKKWKKRNLWDYGALAKETMYYFEIQRKGTERERKSM